MNKFFREIESPIGKLTLIANENALLGLFWKNKKIKQNSEYSLTSKNDVLDEAEKQLREYFSGKRRTFKIPLEFNGTDFQVKVWKALTEIPYGETMSYSELAKKIGSSKASRAVGAANGKNKIGIIIPCHRVIGKDGSLTGFAGGVETKGQLLKLERDL